jgi:hypothetical protein
MKFLVILPLILLTSCAALRPPKYQAPQGGDIAWVKFINASRMTTGIHIYEDAEHCGKKKAVMFLRAGRALKIKVRAGSPFTYSQSFEKTKVNSVRIDSVGVVHSDIGILYCRVMNTFVPEKNRSYVAEYLLPEGGRCGYDIYDEESGKKIKVYERTFRAPTWETGNFCEPLKEPITRPGH